MKAIILAGGFGTRLSELTDDLPKPMVLIDDKPIIFHIMSHLAKHGINEFIILAGYKGWIIKEYFRNLYHNSSDFSIDLSTGETLKIDSVVNKDHIQNWKVSIIDTGLTTMTGGRIRKVKNLIDENENFLITYGDGLSDVNIEDLLNFHKENGYDLTITAVNPPARFGSLLIENSRVTQFTEKPQQSRDFINGGFMISNIKIFDYLKDDNSVLEKEPLSEMALSGKLGAFPHYGFWQCMDTKRDLESLRTLARSGIFPWLD